MATPLVWKAFDLHNWVFSYMYRSPLQMKTDERRIVIEKLSPKHFFWMSANSVVWGLAFALLYIFLRELYNPSGNVPLITFSIYVTLFSFNISMMGTITTWIIETDAELLFNQLIEWNDRLQRSKSS